MKGGVVEVLDREIKEAPDVGFLSAVFNSREWDY